MFKRSSLFAFFFVIVGLLSMPSMASAGSEATLTPSTYEFQSMEIGRGEGLTYGFEVTSTGSAPVSVTGTSVSGPDASAFTIIDPLYCSDLGTGSSCLVQVTFDPETGAPGNRTATLTVDTTGGQLQSTMSGEATAHRYPKISLELKAPKTVKRGKQLVVAAKVMSLSSSELQEGSIRVVTPPAYTKKHVSNIKFVNPNYNPGITKKIRIPIKLSAPVGKNVTVTMSVIIDGKKLATAKVKAKITK